MPISPSQALASVDESVIQKSVFEIDKMLSNPQWIKDWRCGVPGCYHWYVILHQELSEGEKLEIARLYKESGWKDVKVENSSENGERGGLCSVTLYNW